MARPPRSTSLVRSVAWANQAPWECSMLNRTHWCALFSCDRTPTTPGYDKIARLVQRDRARVVPLAHRDAAAAQGDV